MFNKMTATVSLLLATIVLTTKCYQTSVQGIQGELFYIYFIDFSFDLILCLDIEEYQLQY